MLSWKSIPIPNVTAKKSENQLISAVSAQGRACGRYGCCVPSADPPAHLGCPTAWSIQYQYHTTALLQLSLVPQNQSIK